jgi:hypothetical protein
MVFTIEMWIGKCDSYKVTHKTNHDLETVDYATS